MTTSTNNLFDEVKKNSQRLVNCAGPHEFGVIEPMPIVGVRLQCEKCKGIVDASFAKAYLQGFKHRGAMERMKPVEGFVLYVNCPSDIAWPISFKETQKEREKHEHL